MNRLAPKIGAIFYILWGLVHINAAYALLTLGWSLDPGMVQARVFQDAWNILAGAVVAIIVGAVMNWRNSRAGFWINLVLVSLLDTAFVLFVLVPGYAPLWPGLQGPIAWVIAAVFSAVGVLAARREDTPGPAPSYGRAART
ncbi:hypothetical protein [Nonomuraea aridisoli]|uniref:DUF4383 domain-containing protein n=1 Tax=Nonomuraea aridisoli TaxID=2070368 RepID=A0A2W2G2J4_9ACTN|nr:hypothetical protein [Nonomuraea aridisoli]PZG21124.1 hypothetical protein C1J01_07485 [Nonomuraea aridisoli]